MVIVEHFLVSLWYMHQVFYPQHYRALLASTYRHMCFPNAPVRSDSLAVNDRPPISGRLVHRSPPGLQNASWTGKTGTSAELLKQPPQPEEDAV